MKRVFISLAALAVLWAAGFPVLLGQGAVPEIVFESPVDNGYASGPTPVRVRLVPARTAVQSVTISADGTLLCTVERPPFECPWDAGPNVSTHVIRASVLLADGRRVVHLIKTRGEAYTETVDVDVVQVTATVTDGKGRFVGGLTRNNFRVYEDDVPQKISSFFSQNIPLEIVVAMDVSGSMKPSMATVKTAVKKFLSALRPDDQVTVITFNDTVYTLVKPSVDLAARLKAIDRMTAWGETALYEAIVRAVDQLSRRQGRRVLVVFTDGEDVSSRIPIEAVEGRLETSDVVLYSIGQGQAPRVPMLKELLERLATKSGGRAFFEDVKDLDQVFARLVEELSNQYLLGYERRDSARDTRWRKLRVEVPGRKVTVRFRSGYRVVEG
jgi:Ca-activated chloride channel family protein